MAMAQPQGFAQPYAQQNKGTLVPGQTISVNKYTVQVERYLSQGGFAHVYLVRTATPVYNTTHHVLKRIAVPNEAMLTEVKKEVDIMRILKGHPNIVYLIDAAWHRSSNGVYEVFILMEFCSGGGIIDMMNRRLRERLTEPEILTIFVDVCEGLAAMHALKPPLLHRDLKVENILQSSATSYKLCDFGSATPVHRIPTNMQELRALESDLNKHTTLQYRAPEMVDVYQRRPIDEKSDVWALGVLLYKLCYYTTPFEEHGPLAILNVQYKIPPYPVYSPQMNGLIASMLREHGAQRPTVFELLNHVHLLRGSKSRFNYAIPPKQPPVSPRGGQGPLQTLSPNISSPPPAANPLDDLVMFKSRAQSPVKNAGIEARDKVLEAIAPMRRGRPAQTAAAPSPPPSPKKERERTAAANFNLDMKFGAEEDRVWRGVRGHKSGMASIGGGKTVNLNDDAWGLGSKDANEKPSRPQHPGFDSDFSSSFSKGFGDAFEPSKFPALSPSPSKSESQPQAIPYRPTPSPGISGSPSKRKDAFEGLGIPSQPPAQTLGDARRARTSVSQLNGPTNTPTGQYLNAPGAGPGSSFTTYRPPSQSPAPSPAMRPSSRPQSPAILPRAQSRPTRPVELSAEERFPSLEDLDRTFASPKPSAAAPSGLHSTSQPASTERLPERIPDRPSSNIGRPPSRAAANATGGMRTGHLLVIPSNGPGALVDRGGRQEGVRSQQVTGSAMRESVLGRSRTPNPTDTPPQDQTKYQVRRAGTLSHHSRPLQPRRHRSSISMKQGTPSAPSSASTPNELQSPSPPALPPRPSPKSAEQRDWLTGLSDDESQSVPAPQPVLRDSPSKRASFIERSPILIARPLEAEGVIPTVSDFELEREREQQRDAFSPPVREKEPEKPRVAEKRWERGNVIGVAKLPTGDRSRRHDTGRQSPTKTGRSFLSKTATGTGAPVGGLQLPGMGKKAPPVLASSPSGLTDNWSPLTSPTRDAARRTSSSSEDEGPEDINGYVPKGSRERTATTGHQEPPRTPEPSEQRRRHAGRGKQNSVHDLVDLWGGNAPDKATAPTKLADKRRSAIVTSSSMMKPSSPFDRGHAAVSPPVVSPTPSVPSPAPTSSRPLPQPPSTQHVRKQSSVPTGNGAKIPPSASPASPPAVSSSASTGRSRPQSMFINPVAKTTPLESPASSLAAPKDREQADASLTGPKQRRTTRRTSISDMVHRYESINGPTKQGSGSLSVAPKPVPLSVKAVSSESSSTGMPSPSAAAVRFPQLSPPSSPKASKSSLAVPEDPEPTRRGLLQGRRSPSPATRTASPRPLPGLTKSSFDHPNGTRPEPLAPGRPPIERKPVVPVPVPSTDEEQSKTGDENAPERPYPGVSRLIDRWQRAVDDAEGGPNRPVRRPTGSLRGRS